MKVQNVFFFIAPPFSVIFCAGLLWRRANTIGALTTIVAGFLFSMGFDYFIKGQQGVYLHRAFFTWCFCVIVMAFVSPVADAVFQTDYDKSLEISQFLRRCHTLTAFSLRNGANLPALSTALSPRRLLTKSSRSSGRVNTPNFPKKISVVTTAGRISASGGSFSSESSWRFTGFSSGSDFSIRCRCFDFCFPHLRLNSGP